MLREAIMNQRQMARVFGGLREKGRTYQSISAFIYLRCFCQKRHTQKPDKTSDRIISRSQFFILRKATYKQIDVDVHADAVGEAVELMFSGSKTRIYITALLFKITDIIV